MPTYEERAEQAWKVKRLTGNVVWGGSYSDGWKEGYEEALLDLKGDPDRDAEASGEAWEAWTSQPHVSNIVRESYEQTSAMIDAFEAGFAAALKMIRGTP